MRTDTPTPSREATRFVLSALAYVVVTFSFAVAWHLALFGDLYRSLGYFGDQEPELSLGLLAIAAQGLVLAWLFPRFRDESRPLASALRFAGVAGIFLWTSHVAAFAAKVPLAPLSTFLVLETVYLGLQLGLFAVALGGIHSAALRRTAATA